MRIISTLLTLSLFSVCLNAQKNIVRNWTAYSQSVDVTEWEGSEFILSAYIRKENNDGNGKSALWARIDTKDNTEGFFRNDAFNESIKITDEWERFEIKGKIDRNADKLYFGAFCQGKGDFYFDDFDIRIKTEDDNWENLPIDNFGFEKINLSKAWNEGIKKEKVVNVKNFEITFSKKSPFNGKQSLNIKTVKALGSNDNGKFVEVNNVKLYYEIYGEGPPLLMIHGNGQSMGAFINQVEEFSKNYTVILVDCRGRGNSTFDYDIELTYSLEANDINLFLDEIGIDKTHIVGWSDGGIIGLIMAILFPEKVNKLVAMAANINPQGIVDLDEIFDTISELEYANTGNYDLLIALYKLIAYYPKMDYDDLNVIKSKTLIMAGDHDEIKNVHTVKMYEAIENAQLAILPNETHYFPEENPKFFNELVLSFLKE